MKPRRLHSDTILSIVTVSAGGTGAGECRGRQRGGGGHARSYTAPAMPIYEYRCDNGHTFEVLQRMTDDPVVSCQTCEAPVQRVFHPVAVHFKGSGFYNTDYGKKKGGGGSSSESSSSDTGSKSESKDSSSSKDSKASSSSSSSSSSD